MFFWNTAAAAAFISVNSIFMKHQYKKNGTTEYCGTDRLFPALISDLDTMKNSKIKYRLLSRLKTKKNLLHTITHIRKFADS